MMDVAQQTLWNGPAGHAWAEAQEVLDRMFQPFEDLLATGLGRRVLDVGCGTGATTLAAARKLGANGTSIGIDISEPMLAVARARAEREGVAATFILGNAEIHP